MGIIPHGFKMQEWHYAYECKDVIGGTFVNIITIQINTLFSVCEPISMYAHQLNLGGLEFILIWIWFIWFKCLEGGSIKYVIKIGEDSFVKS